jgi:HK97 family phage prohead protease
MTTMAVVEDKALDGLKLSIRALGRVPDQNAERVKVMRTAKDMGADLVPDSWGENGEILETKGSSWTTEQRDTANDMFAALDGAIGDMYADPYCYCWVQDWYGPTEDGFAYTVVYCVESDLWQCGFDYGDDNKLVFGEPVKVRPVTQYVPRSESQPERRKPSLDHTIALRKAKMPKRGDPEHRTLPLERLEIAPYELREAAESETKDGRSLLRFSGYASLFAKRYSVGPYEEEIQPGSFKRSLSNPQLNCVLRVEHEGLPLARTTGQITLQDGSTRPTLILREDDQGLSVDALLDAEDPDVQRLVPKFRRGDLSEMSFAFRCTDDLWNDDYSVRTIRSAEIHRGDVAIVTYGASPNTHSSLRSEGAAATIHERGFANFLAAMVEWRDYTLTPPEERVGKAISSDSLNFLSEMLDLFASADSAVDEGQARLADFLGVDNPNDPSDDIVPDDDPSMDDEDVEDTDERSEVELPVPRDDEFLLELRMLGGQR